MFTQFQHTAIMCIVLYIYAYVGSSLLIWYGRGAYVAHAEIQVEWKFTFECHSGYGHASRLLPNKRWDPEIGIQCNMRT